MGGPFLAPWEIDELDDVTLDGVLALGQDFSEMRQAFGEVEKIKAEWRNKLMGGKRH